MKILATVHWYVPHHNGGAEVMAHSMLRALADRGHSVDVLESRAPLNEAYRHSGYIVDGVRVHPHRDQDDMLNMLPEADVVVTHLENTARTVILCRWMGKPVFVVAHNDQANTRAFAADEDIYHVHNSEWLADALPDVPRSLIVRPPIFSDEYRTPPGDRVTLINLSEDKGSHVFYGLAERMPGTKFLGVVGAHGPQIIRTDLPNVEIVPHTDNRGMRDAVYGRTRVLLMPSIYESWGRCAVEALASGIPVMAHPTNGLTEALGASGVFADRDDLGAWVSALQILMKPAGWRSASRRALARSTELDEIRDQDISRWIETVEGAAL